MLPARIFSEYLPMSQFMTGPAMMLTSRDTPDADMAAASTFKLYHYDPTVAGTVIFILLFLATTGLHFWQMFKSRCWFLLPLAMGGVCELFRGY